MQLPINQFYLCYGIIGGYSNINKNYELLSNRRGSFLYDINVKALFAYILNLIPNSQFAVKPEILWCEI